MTQVYFHCSNTKKVFVDYRAPWWTTSLRRASMRPASYNPSPTSAAWRIGVNGSYMSDDQGDELFVVPFMFVLGEPN